MIDPGHAPIVEVLASAYVQGTLTPQTLAEAIWLLERLQPELLAPLETSQPDKPVHGLGRLLEPKADPEPQRVAPPPVRRTSDDPLPSRQPSVQIVPAHDGPPGSIPNHRTPASVALPQAAELSRALRPLHREIAAPGPSVLDEAATVNVYAETRTLVPISVPITEHWLELALVVDTSLSMALWRPTLTELTRILRAHRAFRDVRIWTIDGDAEQTRLHAGPTTRRAVGDRSPAELTDPTGRRLILIVTDGVGRLWRSTSTATAMSEWSNVSPLAILNVLPERLWHRTQLSAVPVSMRSSPEHSGILHGRAGNPRLRANENDGQRLIPVIGLDPARVSQWASAVAGDRTAGLSMMAVPLPRLQAVDTYSSTGLLPTSTEELVKRFRLTAAPSAYSLATFLSAAPLTVPVMRLIQRELVPDSTPADLAEVFLSGLLVTIPDMMSEDPDQIVYDFARGTPDQATVREELLANLPRTDAFRVLNLLAHHAAREAEPFGGNLDFRTLVPKEPGHVSLPTEREPFAKAVVAVLSGLGDGYQEFAETISTMVDRPERTLAPVESHRSQRPHSKPSETRIGDPSGAPVSDGNEPRRFLIAAAVAPRTEVPQWDSTGLEGARTAIIELFTERFGYTLIDTIRANPTSIQIRQDLRHFCKSPDRRPDDLIVMYFTGHGERLGASGESILVTADTDLGDLEAAFPAADLVRLLLAGTKVRRLLLILDTCFSGLGGAAVTADTLRGYTTLWGDEPDTGIALINSSQPLQHARAGMLPRLLADAVDSMLTADYSPDVLPLDAVITAVRKNQNASEALAIDYYFMRISGTPPPFLSNKNRNPRSTKKGLAIQQAHEREAQTERREFELRSGPFVRVINDLDRVRVGSDLSISHDTLIPHRHDQTPDPPKLPTVGRLTVVGAVPRPATHFVDRAQVYELREALARMRGAVVVCGMRGAGKTQVAAAYAREVMQDGAVGLVGWVGAETRDSALAGMAEIAARVGVADPEGDSLISARRLRDHLNSTPGLSGLLVFDNATDPDFLGEFLPTGGGVRVVITSTDRAFTGLGELVDAATGYDRTESIAYLAAATGLDDPAGADALAAEVGDLPLALAAAAATITTRRLDYHGYRELLAAQPLPAALPRQRGTGYDRTVDQALGLAIDTVTAVGDTALGGRVRWLTGVIAMLSADGVETALIEAGTVSDSVTGTAIDRCVEGSLLSWSTDGRVLVMHRLTARVIRERAHTTATLEALAAAAVAVLEPQLFDPIEAFQRRAEGARLVEHIDALTEHTTAQPRPILDLGIRTAVLGARRWAVRQLIEAADPQRAIHHAEYAHADHRKVLGQDHPDTLTMRHNLALAYRAAGRVSEAIEEFERVLTDERRVLGEEHPATLITRNQLAGAYESVGRVGEAIEEFERVLTDERRVLGEEHPAT
ncbi:SAV_2336 N-terminal domain-related protein, partial [Nocardia sp. NPDC057227]|uniref:SAV_2336 N-terminal domain-related protein n=1 Tax=Nocardia sp. NPDC057227 TaxID=3346056 RepID=UPI003638B3AE